MTQAIYYLLRSYNSELERVCWNVILKYKHIQLDKDNQQKCNT